MIRNLTGCYVLVSETVPPVAVMLCASEQKSYRERVALVGYAKTNVYTFGAYYTDAVPCTVAVLEYMALNYKADKYETEVRQLCARIAVNGFAGDVNGTRPSDGGEKVTQKPTKPRKPRGGVAVPVGADASASA